MKAVLKSKHTQFVGTKVYVEDDVNLDVWGHMWFWFQWSAKYC